MQKKFFVFIFFERRKNYFSIFLTFGFWGGSMAGENIQFEEVKIKLCTKNFFFLKEGIYAKFCFFLKKKNYFPSF